MDILFWIQVTFILVLVTSQFTKMLKEVKGTSISFFLFSDLYFAILLWQSSIAQALKPTQATQQIIIIYLLAVAGYTALLLLRLIKKRDWTKGDNSSLVIVLPGVVLGAALFIIEGAITPINRMILAIALKAAPQGFLVPRVMKEGHSGLSAIFVAAFNLFNLFRISQLVIANIATGWDINSVVLLLAETVNEITWLAVSAAWLRHLQQQKLSPASV
ncbi:MAG: hypothetical protein ABIG40_02560 [Parcubacteria group bacterium]